MDIGDHIIAHTKEGDIQGIVLPSSTKKELVLKIHPHPKHNIHSATEF